MSDPNKPDELAPTGALAPQAPAAGTLAGVLFKPGYEAVSSLKLDTPRGRMLLQKCEEAPDEPVRELVNRRLDLVDVYAKLVDVIDEKTQEVRTYLRICLIDDKDDVHPCGSEGIRQGLARLIAGHGMPPWKVPIPVEVKLKALADKRQRLYLLEVFDQKKGGGK